MRGFTESLRTELLHEGSAIRVSIVELPAVKTPQFDWCKTTMGTQPRPLGRIFQPEVIAEAVFRVAQRERREAYVTLSSAIAIWGDKLFAGHLDRYLAHTAVRGQQSDTPSANRLTNLWQPAPGQAGAHGRFDALARNRSASLWLNMHRGPLAAAAGAMLFLGWVLAASGRRTHPARISKRPHHA